jgi:hypothetical protein
VQPVDPLRAVAPQFFDISEQTGSCPAIEERHPMARRVRGID